MFTVSCPDVKAAAKTIADAIGLLVKTMEKVSMENIAALKTFSDSMVATFAEVNDSVNGLSGDIDALNVTIAKLQESDGLLTESDQAMLDDIQAQATALKVRTKALDGLTVPPAPPVVPDGG